MKDSLENTLKEKLASFESDVPEHMWNSIEAGISSSSSPQGDHSSPVDSVITGSAKTGLGLQIPTIGIIAVISAVTAFTIFTLTKNPNHPITNTKTAIEANQSIEPLMPTKDQPVSAISQTPASTASSTDALAVRETKEVVTLDQSLQTSIGNVVSETNKLTVNSTPIHSVTSQSNANIKSNSVQISPEGLSIATTHQTEPVASIIANPVSGYAPLQVSFSNKGYSSYQRWDFGDGSVYSSYSATNHLFEKPGEYTVILICKDDHGKEFKDEILIHVFEPSAFGTIPNIFTPNNDGYNDVFEISAQNVSTFQMQIFDKFGYSLFTTNRFGNWWDGKLNNGMPAKEDTYYYKISATGTDNRNYQFKGAVRLIR